MRVLHLIQRYPPAVGGSETWCQEVARYQSWVGDRVKVLTLDILEEEEFWREPAPAESSVRLGPLDWDDGVLVRRYRRSLPVHHLYHLVFVPIFDRLLKIYFYGPHSLEMYGRLFREARGADVVHLHTLPYPHNLLGLLAARLSGKRVVVTPHFHPDHPHYERWSSDWLMRRCDAVIAVSPFEKEYLAGRGVAPEKIAVTGNGVHLEGFVASGLEEAREELLRRHDLPEGSRFVLFVGRKMDYKGIDTLIDAWRRLPEHHQAVLLLVGPTSPWFEELYRRLSPEERSRALDLGTVSAAQKVALLHLAAVLVLPSRFEAFGIVLLEAWACGTPVVTSSRGALPSVVAGGGLTFEYGDAAALAARLDEVLSDSELADRLARAGRRQVEERYTWDRIGEATRATYHSTSPPAEGPGREGEPGTAGLQPGSDAGEPRRILICSNHFPPHVLGGAELVAHRQARALRELGHRVQVFAGRPADSPRRRHRIESTGGDLPTTWVHLTDRDRSGEHWDFYDPEIAAAFAAALDDFGPDVVHFHNPVGLSLRAVDECRNRRIPTVLTLHDYWGICFKNTMTKNDGRLCLQGGFDCLGCKETLGEGAGMPSPVRNAHLLLALLRVDRLLSPSRYLAQTYAANGVPAERISVRPYGVEIDRFRPRPTAPEEPGGLTVGCIGYLGAHKGVDVLLRAMAALDAEGTRLLVAGGGDAAPGLEALARELGLTRRVQFLGRVSNDAVPTLYRRIDLLAVPSVWPENSPVTIGEAMASGVPVVASALGGMVEQVEDGVTGFLVPPGDSAALAERIGRFVERPELLREMGARARERAEGLSLAVAVDRLTALYREVILKKAHAVTSGGPSRGQRASEGAAVLLYCPSEHWRWPARELFRTLPEVERSLGRRLLVCRADLADEETLAASRLLLLPAGAPGDLATAVRALSRGIPLLAHADLDELTELCRLSGGGLWYAGRHELATALERLLTDEPLRTELATRGAAYVAGLR